MRPDVLLLFINHVMRHEKGQKDGIMTTATTNMSITLIKPLGPRASHQVRIMTLKILYEMNLEKTAVKLKSLSLLH